jgi:hypothetical protein
MRRPRAPSTGSWLFAFGQLRRNFFLACLSLMRFPIQLLMYN